MAVLLEPGEVTVNLHRAESLKDADWFGKQDPYVILRCGENKYRSNTHERGGRDPAWEQQFVFKVDQETTLELEVYDQDMFKPDDCLGKGKVDIVSVRQIKKMSVEVPLFRRLSRRQAGHVYLTLSFSPARASASSGIRSAAAAATPAATPTAPNPGDAAMSTYVIHEQATAVANQFPTAFPGNGDGRGGDVETRDGAAVAAAGGVLAASSAHIPSGSSLAPGLVPAGSMPDTVPSYNPTCGLIQPHPDRLLPCHVSSSSTANSSTASLGGRTARNSMPYTRRCMAWDQALVCRQQDRTTRQIRHSRHIRCHHHRPRHKLQDTPHNCRSTHRYRRTTLYSTLRTGRHQFLPGTPARTDTRIQVTLECAWGVLHGVRYPRRFASRGFISRRGFGAGDRTGVG
ncbi:hypothetical protein VOLCADRAFT_87207 [Volvox carteri f. nagariensis]|uniref:C2 domain-containing protein n=1 Tax=Volvox carteri f. nagariensis TaxID=3068 RepID=D8TKG1_VOLCA|nr:uncharacterized protein VOLCADRAFT_87207 [Volvox carteri f. nagariensis]EFJ52056.1 hypothetical protein VOLCADRAFT_87207 [Volvox carteri f. nagariensis]|eukprot:XP_002946830.1 hypothetical protein VOLCADRAFT_87207 [Volvox carteri f. nagariensis]